MQSRDAQKRKDSLEEGVYVVGGGSPPWVGGRRGGGGGEPATHADVPILRAERRVGERSLHRGGVPVRPNAAVHL